MGTRPPSTLSLPSTLTVIMVSQHIAKGFALDYRYSTKRWENYASVIQRQIHKRYFLTIILAAKLMCPLWNWWLWSRLGSYIHQHLYNKHTSESTPVLQFLIPVFPFRRSTCWKSSENHCVIQLVHSTNCVHISLDILERIERIELAAEVRYVL